MRRGALIFATLLALWTLAGMCNNALSGLRLHLFIGGLFVTLAAVVLSPRAGRWTLLAAGAVCDTASPLPFGTLAFSFGAAHAVLVQVRPRLPHDHTLGRIAIALIANLALFLLISFFRLSAAPQPAVYWGRCLLDLAASQAAIVLIAPWFFALQERLLSYAPRA